ncbi:zinc-binding alcohol dehydrogenase family protein, partial [Acinetobacter baumannii]
MIKLSTRGMMIMKAVAYQKAGPITLPEALVDIELDTPVAK